MSSTRLIKRVSEEEYKELIGRDIRVGHHALFRLSESQRNLYKADTLIEILRRERPCFVGLQHNGRCAAFFKRKGGYLRIIFEVSSCLEITTFFMTDRLPSL